MSKLFSLLAVLFFVTHSQAAIHVTQVNEEVYGSTRYYDLDNDGDHDFYFQYNQSDYTAYVSCSKPTSYFAADGTVGNNAKAYSLNAGMGTYHWEYSDGFLFDLINSNGFFHNTTKYLMVKFSNGTDVYYGWFLLFTENGILEVISYGYNDVPNATIKPGETDMTGISEAEKAAFALAGISRNTVAFKNCAEFDKVLVYAVDGKTIADINYPVALQTYALHSENSNVMMVAYFRKGQLRYTAKYFVQ
jgi:hypothetical protein